MNSFRTRAGIFYSVLCGNILWCPGFDSCGERISLRHFSLPSVSEVWKVCNATFVLHNVGVTRCLDTGTILHIYLILSSQCKRQVGISQMQDFNNAEFNTVHFPCNYMYIGRFHPVIGHEGP